MTKADLHKAVLDRKDELLKLVSDLIRIPSENPGGDQLTAVRFVEEYLAAAGIETQRVAANPDFPCLLARLGEDDGFSLLANGHLDVVPAGERDGWTFDPFGGEVTDRVIRGRGASDMKAGVAILLFTMRLLQESGAALKGNVRLHLVTDEETGGEYGTSFLCAKGHAEGGSACVVAEPTSNDNIEIGQKGGCHLILKARGVPAHGSLGNYVGDNAIVKLSKVLIHIDKLTAVPGHFGPNQAQALKNSREIATRAVGERGADAVDHLTANVGIITGGTKINMVPDYCEAQVDMRLPIGIDHGEIEDAVSRLITESGVQGVDAVFQWQSDANYTEYDADIVRVFHKNAEQIWGHRVLPAYQWASSDAKYYRMLGIPTIQFGPANLAGIHAYNEDVDIEDVLRSAEIYMLSFCELLGIG